MSTSSAQYCIFLGQFPSLIALTSAELLLPCLLPCPAPSLSRCMASPLVCSKARVIPPPSVSRPHYLLAGFLWHSFSLLSFIRADLATLAYVLPTVPPVFLCFFSFLRFFSVFPFLSPDFLSIFPPVFFFFYFSYLFFRPPIPFSGPSFIPPFMHSLLLFLLFSGFLPSFFSSFFFFSPLLRFIHSSMH